MATVLEKTMTFKEVAYTILGEVHKPLSADEIIDVAIARGQLRTNGQTPKATLSAQLYQDINNNPKSRFIKLGPNMFGLTEWDYGLAFAALEQLTMVAKRLHLGAY